MTASWNDAVRLGDDTLGLGVRAVPLGDEDASARVVIGVAVSVPEPFAQALRDSRAQTGDPAAEAVPPHVTIVPPLVVPVDDVAGVVAHVRAAAARVPRFGMSLAGTATFRPVSQVVFVRVVAGAEECDTLQEHVRSGPLTRELGFPYHPHVTVAHDVDAEALDKIQVDLAGFRAAFDVESLHVFRCTGEGVWQVLADAPLAAGD